MPLTTPLEAPIVATEGTVLVQLPPGVLLWVMVAPTHNAVGPVITGVAFTVTDFVAEHPVVPNV